MVTAFLIRWEMSDSILITESGLVSSTRSEDTKILAVPRPCPDVAFFCCSRKADAPSETVASLFCNSRLQDHVDD